MTNAEKKLYLITYDLKGKNKDYSSLYETIKSYKTWWHYMESTWIIKTSESSGSITKKLIKNVEDIDALLVVRLSEDFNGIQSEKSWEWIERNF